VLHALGAYQLVGKALDLRGSAAHNHNFQAVMGIKMDVQRRNDGVVMGVLMLGEFVGEVAGVVIVDQRDGADGWRRVSPRDLVLYKGVSCRGLPRND
jgi:hypothetical protein